MTSSRRAALAAVALLLLGVNSPALAEDHPAAVTTVPPAVQPVNGAEAATPTFTSLAEAVAAQDGAIADEHLRCLAGAVYFESQGEPLAGQLAVAQVILNRIRSGRFADSVCGVVLQPHQFGFVRGGAIPAIPATRAAYRTAIAVAKVALAQAWSTVAAGALYFNGVRAGHSGSQHVVTIGHHAFYR